MFKSGDHVQQEMTVMFSDIRSFTTLSEAMTPQNFILLMLISVKSALLFRQHRGFIDKYIGDTIMALFPESANDALCKAAIAMQKQVVFLQRTEQQQEVQFL
jgi:two-component system sensor histidine kinase ChiS